MPYGIGFFISAVSLFHYLIGNIYGSNSTITLLILIHISIAKNIENNSKLVPEKDDQFNITSQTYGEEELDVVDEFYMSGNKTIRCRLRSSFIYSIIREIPTDCKDLKFGSIGALLSITLFFNLILF